VRTLSDSWMLGGRRIENRLVLAPLAGIGSWFVRLQARRYGAGLVYSEMVSSHGVARGNQRTLREFLRVHPDEHPVAMQLFGHDPAAMREAATRVAGAGADFVDINMGCPVRKVCKSGAGAALLDEPDRAVAIAAAAAEGGGLPVTVKLRPGLRPGELGGLRLARRLVAEAGVAGVAFHPRHASQEHKGAPDHRLAAELVAALDVPVLVSGGLTTDDRIRRGFRESDAAAVMLARGTLGNPWRFERLLGRRQGEPGAEDVAHELEWVMARCEEHLGVERAGRHLRKFYPWYARRMGLSGGSRDALVTAPTTALARRALSPIQDSRLAQDRGLKHPFHGISGCYTPRPLQPDRGGFFRG
jgi:tRNA-dihydrouridine synthase B